MEVDVPNLLKIYVPKVQRYLASISALRERANPPTVEFEDAEWFASQPGLSRSTFGCFCTNTDCITLSTNLGPFAFVGTFVHELIHAYDNTSRDLNLRWGGRKLHNIPKRFISPTEVHAYYGEAKILKVSSTNSGFGTFDHETAYFWNRDSEVAVKSPILKYGYTDGFIFTTDVIRLANKTYYPYQDAILPAPGYSWQDVFALMRKVLKYR
jgi:hypothetical protein